jgi:hypothetical protein
LESSGSLNDDHEKFERRMALKNIQREVIPEEASNNEIDISN